ncbi:MAG: LysE family translocator [Hyphomicrobiaceae bacterium]|nr:LysE family translocator [Hyphomicrobiaceae bacterium]
MQFFGLSLAEWAVFLPACFALNLSPGPNNILALSNGARFGALRATLAGCGRLLPFAAMIVLTAIGLGALLAASAAAFTVLKLAGAAYLVWLGVKLFRAGAPVVEEGSASEPLAAMALRDGLIAATNPKAILIFTAVLPQFIEPGAPFVERFLTLGLVFLVLEVAAVAVYASGGALAARFGGGNAVLKHMNRVCGGALVLAGGALALARR